MLGLTANGSNSYLYDSYIRIEKNTNYEFVTETSG